MEATILIGTPDAGIFVLRSDQQPIEAKPFVSFTSPIVDIAFNGNTFVVASGERTIKYYSLQVIIHLIRRSFHLKNYLHRDKKFEKLVSMTSFWRLRGWS